jgi:hypothetical protein
MWQFWSRLFDTQGFEEPWAAGTAWTQSMGLALMLANLATARLLRHPGTDHLLLIRRNHVRWSKLWFLFFVALVVGGRRTCSPRPLSGGPSIGSISLSKSPWRSSRGLRSWC